LGKGLGQAKKGKFIEKISINKGFSTALQYSFFITGQVVLFVSCRSLPQMEERGGERRKEVKCVNAKLDFRVS
jgi:hypothetical protein